MRYRITIIILLVVIAGLIIVRPTWGFRVAGFLSGTNGDSMSSATSALGLENAGLKSELALLTSVKDQITISSPEVIQVPVFARFPFNFKNELLLAAGTKSGIVVGQPVLLVTGGNMGKVTPGILLGTVIRVFPESALVRTVFDPSFQVSVRVGKEGMRALFSGGLEPKVTLIPKNAKITSGDSIVSVDPAFPFGSAVGTLREVRLAEDYASQEATAILPYDLADIRIVRVTINHDSERLLQP